jgi:hypothetical protein
MSLKQTAIALDQLFNAIAGGYADETLSARSWRLQSTKPFYYLRPVVDILFFWDKNHCFESYQSEFERKQLPNEYRKK